MLKTSCLKWNAKIKCQGRVRKNRNPGPHEVRAKLPPGSQAWRSCLEPEEGGRTGKLCPALGDPLGQPWNPSMHLTWKTVCVLSESVGTGNRFSTVKWKGQGDLGNPEYHVFPGACLTDGRSVDPSSSEPFWATRSASHWNRTGVRAPGTLSLADALRAWWPLDLVTQVSWEPVTRGPTLPNFFTGWTLESRAYLQACARMHADTDTHTHTPSGALNPVSPFLHSQMFGKKQTFSSASISSSRNPATPPDPRSSPLVPGRSLGHPVSGHSLWPLGFTTSLFPLALLIPAFVSWPLCPWPCCQCKVSFSPPPRTKPPGPQASQLLPNFSTTLIPGTWLSVPGPWEMLANTVRSAMCTWRPLLKPKLDILKRHSPSFSLPVFSCLYPSSLLAAPTQGPRQKAGPLLDSPSHPAGA